jgi:transposase
MFAVESYAAVRRFVFVEGHSRREAARVFGLSRETVSKMCRFSAPPGYVRARPATKPKLGPLIGIVEAILEADRTAPVKQRHTAKRIFERLRDEHGYDGGYTVVKDLVRRQKARGRETFVPLSHPPGHAQVDFGEAVARSLREIGRIERTLFVLDWFDDAELRRRTNASLNKGEARNALARAAFFNRLGEMRDRTFENQRHRASGLNLVTAAIILWNTVYLDRAVRHLRAEGVVIPDEILAHVAPLGWEHIILVGDYLWNEIDKPRERFRPPRTGNSAGHA